MKEGLNVAYLNGAEGYKKIVLGSQGNEGGNEGGNTGGGEAASTIEYLDVSGQDDSIRQMLIMTSSLFKHDSLKTVSPTLMAIMVYSNLENIFAKINHIAIDVNVEISTFINNEVKIQSIKENLLQSGITQEQLDAIPRITKEEFYTL